ncbi:ATP-binding protein [[Kitasatospora] papulosa]|uniref:ATP-binding protein n=1 Tax=[Kitasatospora] papulosa TaxID=1464011 RepID=UPI0036C6D93E
MEAAALVVAELSSNAVIHGHVPGRDFLLTMMLTPLPEDSAGILRIEVSDCRGERLPAPVLEPPPAGEHGWGLFLVDMFASRWGVVHRTPAGKTVWAELSNLSQGGGR